MKTLIHWLRLMFEPGGATSFMREPKRWRVVYPDKQSSVAMSYETANSYKNLYGGELERVIKP